MRVWKTRIIRRIDDIGRVVIPKEIRHKLNIKEGDPLEISIKGKKFALNDISHLANTENTYLILLTGLCQIMQQVKT